ncbi:MAG: hypothetical protein M3N08_04800 [Pseudomonadota bacterium]|nr:hypothetical protein [Pseudomonadota bacterium]
MFHFLGAYEHVHLIKEYMKAGHEAHKVENAGYLKAKQEFKAIQDKKRLIEEEDARIDGEAKLAQYGKGRQEQRSAEAGEEEEWISRAAPTLVEISQATGIDPDQVRQSMKAAEADFVHRPHPEHPDKTRFAIREHVEQMGFRNWQPGIGF